MHKFKKLRQHTQQTSQQYFQKGSTLVEVIVAIFILSFGVLVLMLAQINSVNISINAANQNTVTNAVQNYVEYMKANVSISLKEKEDSEENKIVYTFRDYSKFKSDNCVKKLNIKLINSAVTECKITADGKVTVKWREESDASAGSDASDASDASSDFSYTLQAGQA